MRIGELSHAVACSAETIRYYEREGILPAAPRAQNGYRRYDSTHVARLQFIRQCRELNIPLADIVRLLAHLDNPQIDCAEVNLLLDQQIEALRRRISELRGLRARLEQLRAQCGPGRSASKCGVLRELAEAGWNRKKSK